MSKQDQLQIYQDFYKNSKPLKYLNGKASEDNYWIEAGKELDIEHLRYTNQPHINIYFDPPYLVAPNKIFNFFSGLSVREYRGGKHAQFNPLGVSLYSSYRTTQRKKFTYNDTTIVSEGVMDAELISLFYPFSFACLGSIPSNQTITLLDTMTRKFVFVPDADRNKGKLNWKLNKKTCDRALNFDIIEVPKEVNDPGELLERRDESLYKLFKNKLLSGL